MEDEASHAVGAPLRQTYWSPVKDQIRLAGEEIMGYVEIIAGRTAPVDDLTVFGIFLAVCSAP